MDEITVVGNYVDIPPCNKINLGGSNLRLTFVGKMNYEPNVLAVEFFCKEVLPDLLRFHSNVEFYIVGAKPDKRVMSLAQQPVVTVTGFVDSIEPYLIDTSIVVAPMLTGSGIQNKIIQSMAHGCCVVTTSIGAEGLSVEESGLTICNTKDEWINSLTSLLGNKEERRKRGQLSRQYIINTMSKDIVREQFKKFINK